MRSELISEKVKVVDKDNRQSINGDDNRFEHLHGWKIITVDSIEKMSWEKREMVVKTQDA